MSFAKPCALAQAKTSHLAEPMRFERSPKSRGHLCYQWILDNYLVNWYRNKQISAAFYNDIVKEIDVLSKTKYARSKISGEPQEVKNLTLVPEIDEVQRLPSNPNGQIQALKIVSLKKEIEDLHYLLLQEEESNNELNILLADSRANCQELEQKHTLTRRHLQEAEETIQELTKSPRSNKQVVKNLTLVPEIDEVQRLPSNPSPGGKPKGHNLKRGINANNHKDGNTPNTTIQQAFVSENKITAKGDSQNVDEIGQIQALKIVSLKKEIEDLHYLLLQEEESNNELNILLADSRANCQELEQKHTLTRRHLQRAEETIQELTKRLSKMAGDNLRYGNPNLADLSDPFRPTELGKLFSEIYDNEWSDAYEDVTNDEKGKIRILYDIMMGSYRFCCDALEIQENTIHQCLICPLVKDMGPPLQEYKTDTVRTDEGIRNAVKDTRKKMASETAKQLAEIYTTTEFRKKIDPSLSGRIPQKLERYARKCAELCWFMVICDPPLAFSENKNGEKFNSDIFRPYTRSQKDLKDPVIEMTVWPALYLHEGGPMLSKGVAQPVSEKEFGTHNK